MVSKILIAKTYGNSNVLEYITQELPTLQAGMARIQVKVAGINPIDARRMSGEFRHGSLPQTFGTEFSGIIIGINPEESAWKIGDEVLGSGGSFTHASAIDVPIGNLIAKPVNVSWEVAGTVAGVAQTAMTILDQLGAIKSLLIHGASGGVGTILIQLAKEKGIQVLATASEKNLTYLKKLGAKAVSYGAGLNNRIEAVHPYLFDASVDMSGTEEATQTSLEFVKPNGIISTIAGKPASSPRVISIWVKRNTINLKHVVDGIANDKFHWEIDKTFSFDDAQEAYNYILKGHTKGKIALKF